MTSRLTRETTDRRIALGTIHWAMPDGAATRAGQPPTAEIEWILARARCAGVRLLDTTPADGTWENADGVLANGYPSWRIVCKLDPDVADRDPLRPVRLDVDEFPTTILIGVAASARGRGVRRAGLCETTRLAARHGIQRLRCTSSPTTPRRSGRSRRTGFSGSPCAPHGEKLVTTRASQVTSA